LRRALRNDANFAKFRGLWTFAFSPPTEAILSFLMNFWEL
jgi:hypothetical protein